MNLGVIKSVIATAAITIMSLGSSVQAQTIQNDVFWKDTGGNFIYSQGGGVIQVGDTFYWYGVKYNGAVTYAANPTKKNGDTGFAGVTCYSSKDLVNWKFEGIVLKPDQAAGGWFGRIGVVYNAKTKKYVLAGQGGSPSWQFGEYFATSSSPTGPFKFARVQPESEMTFFVNNNTGDQTLFQDDDGKAYVIASNVKGRTNLYVAPLRESDFLAIDGSRTVNIHKSRVGGREGNAMFKYNGVYYFCSSDLHGWNTSQTYCMSAKNILGPYSEEFILEGTQHDFSHVTQTGFFIQVKGTKGSFVVNAGDRWSNFAGNGLGYNQWLPISFETGKPVFHSLSQWNINAKEGTWSVGDGNNYCMNPTFEADRVSQTSLTGWKLAKTSSANINSTSKKRTGRWGLYLTGSNTISQTLTVPNGKYKLSAYVQSSGGQKSAKIFAKDFGASEVNTDISAASSSWKQKNVAEFEVKNGKVTIGFSIEGANDKWIAIDDIELVRISKSEQPKDSAKETVTETPVKQDPNAGKVYYVAPSGNDKNAGTKDKPFASLNKANAVVNAGDTVWIRGGTYKHTDTSYVKNDNMFAGIHLTKSGKSDNNRIHYLAYPGEKPIIDFSKMPIANGSNNIRYTSGILIQAQYLHLKGLEVKNVPMKGESNVGVYVSRSKHIFLELIDSHHNGGSGFFVNEKGSGSGGGHYFLNCDSHDNYDPNGRQGDGQNADGFGVHYQTGGDTTKFVGCRAWWNSDDGWDFISQEFPVVIENSWAMGHGYSNYGTGKPKDGNGNGFKAGSSKTGVRHTIRNCVAWKNKAAGFYANHSSGGNDWINNTAYMNGNGFNMWASTWDANGNRTDGVVLKGSKAHVMKNNIAFPNKTSYIGGNYAAGEYNTWNLNITPKESDFLSVSDPSMTVTGRELGPLGGALGPRKADGSLPDVDFLKLAPKSQMIDKGVKAGLPYVGKAPDLGAYEYGAVSSSSVASSSSSDMRSESSSNGTTSIAMKLSRETVVSGNASIFDLQGRYLGTLQAELLRDGDIAKAIRAKFGKPGVYLVKQGNKMMSIHTK